MYSTDSQIEQEIRELHQFFQDWFNGVLPQSQAAFSRFSQAMDDDFMMISPDGAIVPLVPLQKRLWAGHKRGESSKIWVKNVAIRRHFGGTVLASYEEWQQVGDQPATGRLSSALFQIGDENRPIWLYLHETWLL